MTSLPFASRPSIGLALCVVVLMIVLAVHLAGRAKQPPGEHDPLEGMDTLCRVFLGAWGGIGLDALTSGHARQLVAAALPWTLQAASGFVLVGWLPAAALICLCCGSKRRRFVVWVAGVLPVVLIASARLLLYGDVPPWP